ncbi:nitroreductase family protein [Chitinispirillales bacterium ANBcel5]|uniref:nitroreductase family protein n=1 Tax=Cellulosispirillum alkaliphilum TaxID=3039283 RepID=UPI002A53BEC6|nr:nitroreductase family protein [Chitinispirillales bacterium ANBcel5]
MSDFYELIKKRYSVRGYLNKQVEEEKLVKVLDAGRNAPSACNIQPWSFIVIRDEQVRNQLGKVYSKEWILSAPLVIAVCCDRNKSWKRSDGKDYGDVDAAIAMDHITLAAAELGLGTCWVGAFDPGEASKLFQLPDHIEPVLLTPLGYPAVPSSQKSRKALEEVVHWDYYGGQK